MSIPFSASGFGEAKALRKLRRPARAKRVKAFLEL